MASVIHPEHQQDPEPKSQIFDFDREEIQSPNFPAEISDTTAAEADTPETVATLTETVPETEVETTAAPTYSPDTATTPEPAKKSFIKTGAGKAVAGVAALATFGAAGVGLLSAKGGESSDDRSGDPVATAEETPAAEAIFANEGGNIHPAVLNPGEASITVQRLGGAEVEIPATLREFDPANPADFVNSAFALFAGYVNSGDERALQAFSTHPDVQRVLREKRDYFMETYPEYGDVQWAVFDSPDNPAQFGVSSEVIDGEIYQVIRLVGGSLFDAYTEDDRWQGPVTNVYQGDLETDRITSMDMYYGPGANGQPTVFGFHYDLADVQYADTIVE